MTKKTLVYEGVPSTNSISTTDLMNNAFGFYLTAPEIGQDELDIDFFLQLQISINEYRLIPINFEYILDSVRFYKLPLEYQFCDFNIRGVFYSSINTILKIFILKPDKTFEDLQNDLNELKENQETIKFKQDANLALDTFQSIAITAQNASMILLAGGLAPITLGATLPATAPLLALAPVP